MFATATATLTELAELGTTLLALIEQCRDQAAQTGPEGDWFQAPTAVIEGTPTHAVTPVAGAGFLISVVARIGWAGGIPAGYATHQTSPLHDNPLH
ncbi:hypothetical protein D7D52_35890 [Nocardia yunnanensis]|uniref:Uncharacterized protein n=1 Tax=Nocardia yunnanensis TaxID=2382165 RepID=A0A386ZKD2_9NOCA|nr:hypothetical protein [Nocardia yunnanensis]AYF78322.1 hypothetical protein D7D52_35890 [Nocardia yunnanensis]